MMLSREESMNSEMNMSLQMSEGPERYRMKHSPRRSGIALRYSSVK